jgi:transcriptional regulator with XRE-family HTH domain
MKKHEMPIYRTITRRRLALSKLTREERPFIARVHARYQKAPEWSKFAAWWVQEFAKRRLKTGGLAYRICQDLEARLGIAQGKVAPPDYRDYLADLIEEKYGSRYKFCKETGVDPGHLSRVFASRSDLSLDALKKLLQALGAALVVQEDDSLRANASLEEASRALAGVA